MTGTFSLYGMNTDMSDPKGKCLSYTIPHDVGGQAGHRT